VSRSSALVLERHFRRHETARLIQFSMIYVGIFIKAKTSTVKVRTCILKFGKLTVIFGLERPFLKTLFWASSHPFALEGFVGHSSCNAIQPSKPLAECNVRSYRKNTNLSCEFDLRYTL